MAEPDQIFFGTIKSYNPDKGWGHIECDQTRQIYGKDMFVLRSQLNGARVAKGDQVEFRVRQGQQGTEATAVRLLSGAGVAVAGYWPGSSAEAAAAAALGLAPPGTGAAGLCAAGCGGPCYPQPAPLGAAGPCWGPVANQAWGAAAAGCGGCSQLPPGTAGVPWPGTAVVAGGGAEAAAAAPPAGPFTGVVRSFSAETGWGLIHSEQAMEFFGGRDALLPPGVVVGGAAVRDGEEVRFMARLDREGPMATEVHLLSAAYGASQIPAPVQHWGTQAHPSTYPWGAALPGAPSWGVAPPGAVSPSAATGLPPGGLPPSVLPPSGLSSGGLPPGGVPPSGLSPGGVPPSGVPPSGLPGTMQPVAMQPGPMPLGGLPPGAMPPVGLPNGADQSGMVHPSTLVPATAAPNGAAALPPGATIWGAGTATAPADWGSVAGACPQQPPQYAVGLGAGACPGAHLWGAQAAQQPMGMLPVGGQRQVFYGVVKSFDDEKGWGHIACDATRQMFGKDMFVLRSALHGAKIAAGDEVQFTLRQGLRGVEATEVRPLSGAAHVSEEEAAGREYVGILKMFDSSKGWGFLECDESRQLYGKDIFVHKREFPRGCTPDNGDSLRFTVERGSDGRPEARKVSPQDSAPAGETLPIADATTAVAAAWAAAGGSADAGGGEGGGGYGPAALADGAGGGAGRAAPY